MKTKCQTRTIEEAIETLIDYRGKTPPKTMSGVWLVTAKVIKDGFIHGDNKEFIAYDYYDEYMRRGLPRQWDVLVTTEAPLGEVAQIRTPEKIALAQRVILLRANPNVVDQGFLYQAMKSDFVQGELKARSTGTTVLGIKQSELWKVKIPWYPLPIQRTIAGILSAYDDLIENNTRRIVILEEMAQSIYREWFVHFRFPGHEKVKLIDSTLGKIPEGWEVVAVGDVLDTFGGGTPSTKIQEYWDNGTITWYSPTDLTKADAMFIGSSGTQISEEGLKNSSAKLFPAYSVMMTSRATIGVVSITTVEACTNQGFITCVPNSRLSAYIIYFWLNEQKEKIVSIATGATFKEISRGTFRKLLTIVPPQTVRQAFDDAVAPMCMAIDIILKKQKNLKNARDLLLPKLISGQLDVESLDIDAGEPLAGAEA